MIKGIQFRRNWFENTGGVGKAIIVAEQADELGLEEVLIVKAVFYYEREDCAELFWGSAEVEEESGRVSVDVRGNVGSLGKSVESWWR